MFQSTHPCGVRLRMRIYKEIPLTFQSTHPCGVRRYSNSSTFPILLFQSTHPCGVRLDDLYTIADNIHVSIHAPLRGATKAC